MVSTSKTHIVLSPGSSTPILYTNSHPGFPTYDPAVITAQFLPDIRTPVRCPRLENHTLNDEQPVRAPALPPLSSLSFVLNRFTVIYLSLSNLCRGSSSSIFQCRVRTDVRSPFHPEKTQAIQTRLHYAAILHVPSVLDDWSKTIALAEAGVPGKGRAYSAPFILHRYYAGSATTVKRVNETFVDHVSSLDYCYFSRSKNKTLNEYKTLVIMDR